MNNATLLRVIHVPLGTSMLLGRVGKIWSEPEKLNCSVVACPMSLSLLMRVYSLSLTCQIIRLRCKTLLFSLFRKILTALRIFLSFVTLLKI